MEPYGDAHYSIYKEANGTPKGSMSLEPLLQLSTLTDFVKLLLWTGQLSDERPASAIIIAPAGAGKTSLLENMKCEQCEFMGDITARTMAGLVKNSDKITHVLLGDLLSMFGHKSSTVKLTMRLISQMTGETLAHDPWTGDAIKPRQIGLITAIPPEDYEKEKKKISAGGFATRFMIIKYSYKKTTIAAIHKFISQNKYAESIPGKFIMQNPGKQKIFVPEALSSDIKDFGMTLKTDPLGFRAHRHLRSLVKASARRNERGQATKADLDIVTSYCDFFSQDGKEL